MANKALRPTKKQRELLNYIENFIKEHGYSPSYREIMAGLGYNSVATVSLHVNSLIQRGHLRKRDHSARSIEVVGGVEEAVAAKVKPSEEKWLVDRIEQCFAAVEQGESTPEKLDELYVLVGALKVLGFDGAARAFIARLSVIRGTAN